MGDIIQFHKRSKSISNQDRFKALAKGELDSYTCDNCGTEFEVAFNDKPDYCPGCHARILWGEDE